MASIFRMEWAFLKKTGIVPAMSSQHINDINGDPIGGTLFIMGNFPEQSQTFIQREMTEMKRRGISVNIFADTQAKHAHLEPALQEIERNTLYRPHPGKWIPGGILNGMRSPVSFAATVKWALSLPHRSHYHRARFFTALLTASALAPTVLERGYRYIHAHFAAYQTEVAMCLSRLTGLPYGATWHAYGIWKDRNILKEKIEGAEVILSCTANNVRHLEALAPGAKHRVRLVYHGLDLERLPEPSDIPISGPPVWLAIGRLTPKKGFDYLIEAAELLRKRGVRFQIDIAGDGPQENELRQKIARYGLQEVVKILGAIPSFEVFERLASARGLIAPSIRDKDGDIDGIPNVLLEAMAMKRPVIGTNLSGIPEVVRNGETGVLVSPENAEELADAMVLLMEDLDFAKRAGEKGRELVEREFDVRRAVDKQIEILAKAQKRSFRGAV